jgi:hypothetical protein
MDQKHSFLEGSINEINRLSGINVVTVKGGQVPSGTMWYSKTLGTVFVNRFSDLTYEQEWPKFLQEQKTIASRSLAAKAVELRFELGLPLHG